MQYPRRVKIATPDSPFFTLSAPQFAGRLPGPAASLVPSSSDGKVAPHATVQYTLTFTPQSRADYALDLMVITEREKFLIPVRVMGDRGMWNFDDEAFANPYTCAKRILYLSTQR
jgi:hydrocephalus-inducing protein